MAAVVQGSYSQAWVPGAVVTRTPEPQLIPPRMAARWPDVASSTRKVWMSGEWVSI